MAEQTGRISRPAASFRQIQIPGMFGTVPIPCGINRAINCAYRQHPLVGLQQGSATGRRQCRSCGIRSATDFCTLNHGPGGLKSPETMTASQIATLQVIYICIAAWVGLCVGSFLNVVIYRLPIMIKRRQVRQQHKSTGAPGRHEVPFNLSVPRSRCPSCGHQIRWFENIPIASYLALGGKCSACQCHISKRYPLVEFVTSILFAFWIWIQGVNPLGIFACICSAVVLGWWLIVFDRRRAEHQ